jgi:hypothetical protein
MYEQSSEWAAKNILTKYSYNYLSAPNNWLGILVVGVIGGWSPTSVPYLGF